MAASFSFIGTGNMGGALARAVCAAVGPENLLLYDLDSAKAQALAAQLGARSVDRDTAAAADCVFLAVKPHLVAPVLQELPLARHSVLVSMAAGVTVEKLERLAPDRGIVRIMPNTPVGIGAGVVLWCANGLVTGPRLAAVRNALAPAGLVEQLDEHLMDAATTVTGCSPAFTDLYIEALADGGVACGLPRALALRLASAAVAGSARLVLESGAHPGALKDAVCSPGGSTIQGVRTLEKHGFRSAVIEAVIAGTEKNGSLGK